MSVAPYMNDGEGTVGTMLNIKHLAATPAGMIVWCESELKEVDGRRLVFHVEAFDESGKIGEGEHERFIVKNEKFMDKTLAKRKISNSSDGGLRMEDASGPDRVRCGEGAG